ncbi:MAG: SIMPL domain-containing protein [Actinomycetota bacterium]
MGGERGVIRVSVTERGTVTARRARLHVTVESDGLAFGDAALEACGEIADLVGRLTDLGAAADDIGVSRVVSGSATGLLTAETRTAYTVAAGIDDPPRLGEYLRAVSIHKGVVCSRVEWIFDEQEAAALLAAAALAGAREKARRMAAAVGAEVVGLKAACDGRSMPGDPPAEPAPPAPGTAQNGPADAGTDFTSRREIAVTVTADFWVAPSS